MLYKYTTSIQVQLSTNILNNLSINKSFSVCFFGVVTILIKQIPVKDFQVPIDKTYR